jgi:hypothetical protein
MAVWLCGNQLYRHNINQLTMKTIIQSILFALLPWALSGQNLTGEWNGALNIQGTQLKITIHVDKPNDQYLATLDSPDQNVAGIKVTAIDFDYPNVKFEIAELGAIYEGSLTDSVITGKWEQSRTALFLVLTRREVNSNEEL